VFADKREEKLEKEFLESTLWDKPMWHTFPEAPKLRTGSKVGSAVSTKLSDVEVA